MIVPSIFFHFHTVHFIRPSRMSEIENKSTVSDHNDIAMPSLVEIVRTEARFVQDCRIIGPVSRIVRFVTVQADISQITFVDDVPVFIFQ